MTPISFAGSGVVVLLIEAILNHFGITPEDGTVMSVVNSFVTVVGWALLIVGQLRRTDLHFGLIRKS